MKKIQLFLLFALAGISLHAQETWTNYSAISNTIKVITTGPDGNLWFGGVGSASGSGGGAGITVYDGVTWKSYNSANSGLTSASGALVGIVFDGQGNEWLATSDNGLYKFDGVNWTNYNSSNSGLTSNYLRCMAIDAQGSLWLGTSGYGLNKFDGNTWTTYNTTNSQIASNYIYSIVITPENNIWIGSGDGYLIHYDGTNWIHYGSSDIGLSESSINIVALDKNNNIWAGTNGGLAKFDGSGFTTFTSSNSGLANNNVQALAMDNDNSLWVGYGTQASGLSKFDGNNWKGYTTSDGLASNNVYVVNTDKNGNIWCGYGTAYNDGLSKFDGTAWTTYNSSNTSLSGNTILPNAIKEDSKGNFWIGATGLCKFDGVNWTVYNNANAGGGAIGTYNGVSSIGVDSHDNIWFYGTNVSGQISEFDGENWQVYSDVVNSPHEIATDAEGNVWVASDKGLSKFDGTNWNLYIKPERNSIAIDKNGNIWTGSSPFGSQSVGGVTKFDGNNWTTYTTADGLANNSISDIAIDSKGNIWAAARNNGLSEYDGNGWTNYPNTQLQNTNVIAVDKEDNIWIGTADNGVFKFDGNNAWTNYTNSNTGYGLGNASVLSIFIDSHDNKWFGTEGGGVSVLSTAPPVMQLPTGATTADKTVTGSGSTDFTQGNYIITTLTPSGSNPVSGSVTATVNIDNSVQNYDNQPYVQRHYDIEPSANAATATATVTLYYSQAEFDAYNNYISTNNLTLPLLPTGPADAGGISHIIIAQYHGTGTAPGNYSGSAVKINPDDDKIVWNNDAGRWEITFDITGFSGFYLSAKTNTLPIHLLSFSGTLQNSVAHLNWTTGTESNFERFEVQKTTSAGKNFVTIATVPAKGTNSSYSQNTVQTDNIAYYRLAMVDLDGTVSYSNILKLSGTQNITQTLYPNPAKTFIHVVSVDTGILEIYDAGGRKVKSQKISDGDNPVDVHNLAPGIYFVIVNGRKEQFIKE